MKTNKKEVYSFFKKNKNKTLTIEKNQKKHYKSFLIGMLAKIGFVLRNMKIANSTYDNIYYSYLNFFYPQNFPIIQVTCYKCSLKIRIKRTK